MLTATRKSLILALAIVHGASAQRVETYDGLAFVATTDADAYFLYSVDVATMKTEIGEGDYARVEDIYLNGEASEKSAHGFLSRDLTGEPFFNLFNAFYSNPYYLNDTALSAIQGVAPYGSLPYEAARAEVAEKMVQDAAAVMYMFHELHQAVLQAFGQEANEEPGKLPEEVAKGRHSWEEAFALYVGEDRTASLFGRAVKRQEDFSTSGTDLEANRVIFRAFVDGLEAIDSDDPVSLDGHAKTVIATTLTTYVQCVLRYAYTLDFDLANNLDTVEHQAEGYAFWAIIAPIVAIADTSGTQFISSFLQVGAPLDPSAQYYCSTKAILERAVGDLSGVYFSSIEAIGQFSDADGVECFGGIVYEGIQYIASSDVSTYFDISRDVAAMKVFVENRDWASANVLYTTPQHSTKSIMDLVTRSFAGEAYFDLMKAYYDEDFVIDNRIRSALNGDAPYDTSEYVAARGEMIEKLAQDAAAVWYMFHELTQAGLQAMGVDAGEEPGKSPALADGRHSLDEAFALYVGGDTSSGLFARAQKRALDFGTAGTANDINRIVIQAFVDALEALNSNPRNVQDYITAIEDNVIMVYLQGILRYAYLRDQDRQNASPIEDVREHQAEGSAFLLIVAPFIAEVNPAGASELEAMFSLTSSTQLGSQEDESYYCKAFSTIQHFLGNSAVGPGTPFGQYPGTEDAMCNEVFSYQTLAYRTATNVVKYLNVSLDVAAIKQAIGQGDYDTAYQIFRAPLHSSKPVAELLNRDLTGEPDFDLRAAYFGSMFSDYDLVVSAFQGEGLFGEPDNQGGRAEIVEKECQDVAAVLYMIHELYQAGLQAEDLDANEEGDKPAELIRGGLHSLDEAFGLYVGYDRGSSIFGRAIKRQVNFGTLSTAYNANEKVFEAFIAAQQALLSDPGSAQQHIDTIIEYTMVTYAQSTLRYAFVLEQDLQEGTPTEEHQMEGYVFWRIIAPYVAKADSTGAAYITAFYTPGSKLSESERYYCNTYATIKRAFEDPSVPFPPLQALGVLEGTEAIDCDGSGTLDEQAPAQNSSGTMLGAVFSLLCALTIKVSVL